MKTKDGTHKRTNEEDGPFSFEVLSEMTGFPVDLIKKELALEGENVSMDMLRESMINLLNNTIKIEPEV